MEARFRVDSVHRLRLDRQTGHVLFGGPAPEARERGTAIAFRGGALAANEILSREKKMLGFLSRPPARPLRSEPFPLLPRPAEVGEMSDGQPAGRWHPRHSADAHRSERKLWAVATLEDFGDDRLLVFSISTSAGFRAKDALVIARGRTQAGGEARRWSPTRSSP
jgi:hypothetical protein